MGRRVLITSLGNLNRLKRGDGGSYITEEQSYHTVAYSINGKSYESCYIAEAYLGTEEADAVILIGTAGSDWGGLYGYAHMQDDNLLVRSGAVFDGDYYDSLAEFTARGIPGEGLLPGDIDPATVTVRLSALKEALTDRILGIVPVRYGRNEDELRQVIGSLYEIEALLEKGDELIIDVTHGFRSLYLFQILAFTYFRSTAAAGIGIRDIAYGMLSEDRRRCDVVSLRLAFETMDFIHAAEEFKELGTVYTLPANINDGLNREDRKLLRDISRTVSVNNVAGFMELVERCRDSSDEDAGRGAGFESRLMTGSIRRDIADYFDAVDTNDEIHMQLRLAQWHFAKKQYISAAVTMEEGLISFVAELLRLTDDSFDARLGLSRILARKPAERVVRRDERDRTDENAVIRLCENRDFKRMIENPNVDAGQKLRNCFYLLRILRNYLAHAHSRGNAPSEESVRSTINSLGLLLDTINAIYRGSYMPDAPGRAALAEELRTRADALGIALN